MPEWGGVGRVDVQERVRGICTGVQSCWIELVLNISGKRKRRRTGEPPLPRRSQQKARGTTRTCREGEGRGRGRASVELVGKARGGDSENVGLSGLLPGPESSTCRRDSKLRSQVFINFPLNYTTGK